MSRQQTTSIVGHMALFGLLLPAPVLAQRDGGWWVGMTGGYSNVAQACGREALSLSCVPTTAWGYGEPQLGGGVQVGRSVGLGLDLAMRRVEVFRGAANVSGLSTVVVQATATIFPAPAAPFFIRMGVGGGGFRLEEQLGPNTFRESGRLWAASMAAGAEFRVVGPVRAGPILRLDQMELGQAGGFFGRLQQRVLSIGLAVTIRAPGPDS